MKYCIGCRVSSEKSRRLGKGLFVGGWCEDCVGRGEGLAAEVGDKRLLGMPIGFRVEVNEEVVKRDLERIDRLNKRGSRAKVRYCGCGEVLDGKRRVCDDCRIKRVSEARVIKNIESKERCCKSCGVVVGPRRSYCVGCNKARVKIRVTAWFSKKSLEERLLELPDDKVCSKCNVLKPITDYYVNKSRGIYSHCKGCHHKYNIEAKRRNKEKYLAYHREYQRNYRKVSHDGVKKGDYLSLNIFYNPQP